MSSVSNSVELRLNKDERELLIRDMQKGKDGVECMTNFARNLVKENL